MARRTNAKPRTAQKERLGRALVPSPPLSSNSVHKISKLPGGACTRIPYHPKNSFVLGPLIQERVPRPLYTARAMYATVKKEGNVT